MPESGRVAEKESALLPTAHPAVIFQPVTDGAVLLNTESEVYFGLNAVGMDVWRLLPPTCATLDELCTALVRKYPQVDVEEIRRDASALLDELTMEGLALPPARTGAV